jgi:hypothetical protein
MVVKLEVVDWEGGAMAAETPFIGELVIVGMERVCRIWSAKR